MSGCQRGCEWDRWLPPGRIGCTEGGHSHCTGITRFHSAEIDLNSKSLSAMPSSSILDRCVELYLSQSARVWNRLPWSLRNRSSGCAFGRHLNRLVRAHAERRQSFGTFFLRNRAELELLRRFVAQKPYASRLDMSVLACSKGAEVYSMVWAIRSVRPDLQLNLHAMDISGEILDFAAKGVFSLSSADALDRSHEESAEPIAAINWNTSRDQNASLFERLNKDELEAMFEVQGDQARVRQWLKEGITWCQGNAGDPNLLATIGGPQEIVVANRFLCHMKPVAAEQCLRNISRLVRAGGYLFVSGVDLDVRTAVARELDWTPVTELMREIHEGDSSIRRGWPLNYWGLEPFDERRKDWQIRYSSVFQIGKTV